MEKRTSQCEACDEIFASDEELKKHNRSVHSDERNQEIEEAGMSGDEETAA